MLRVLSMVSGGGTNLQAIIDSVKNGMITNTELVGVISNNKNAYDTCQRKWNRCEMHFSEGLRVKRSVQSGTFKGCGCI